MKRIDVQTLAASAAELIRCHGWLRRRYGGKGLGFCAAGAVQEAEQECADREAASIAGGQLIALIRHRTGKSVVEWNDEQWSVRPVLDMLDSIAAIEGVP